MQLDIDERVTEELDRAKENNRLLHVYLFYGGDDKTMLDEAKLFAAKLYCGCLNCPTCKAILEDNHLNVKHIGIEEGKTMITKEQINALEAEFSMTSLIIGPRIYIIDGIDTASQAAQNSLLKFIEEPTMQDEVYGILIAYDLNNVLTTIKSRCGLIRFMPKSFRELEDALAQKYSLDDAFMLASLTNNLTLCEHLYNDINYIKVKDLLYSFLNLSNSKDAVLFYLANRDISKTILQYFLKLLINIYHETLTLTKLLSSPIYDKITALKQNNSKAFLEDRLNTLLRLETKLKYNVVEKNVLHELIISFF